MIKKYGIWVSIGVFAFAGAAYASFGDSRTPVEFFTGHTHGNGQTVNAPQHSGGTNSLGCHNGSVPYHCH